MGKWQHSPQVGPRVYHYPVPKVGEVVTSGALVSLAPTFLIVWLAPAFGWDIGEGGALVVAFAAAIVTIPLVYLRERKKLRRAAYAAAVKRYEAGVE
jgi:hypothetical protein